MNVEEVRDAAGNLSLYNTIDVAPYGDGGQYIVTLTLDEAFLTDPGTVHPLAAASTMQEVIGSSYINDTDVNSPAVDQLRQLVHHVGGLHQRREVQKLFAVFVEPYESYIAPYGISDAYMILYEKPGTRRHLPCSRGYRAISGRTPRSPGTTSRVFQRIQRSKRAVKCDSDADEHNVPVYMTAYVQACVRIMWMILRLRQSTNSAG